MSQNLNSAVAVIGIDIGKNSFHVVGLDNRGAIVLRQNRLASEKWPRCPLWVMCGRLRVGKGYLHECSIGRCSHVFGL